MTDVLIYMLVYCSCFPVFSEILHDVSTTLSFTKQQIQGLNRIFLLKRTPANSRRIPDVTSQRAHFVLVIWLSQEIKVKPFILEALLSPQKTSITVGLNGGEGQRVVLINMTAVFFKKSSSSRPFIHYQKASARSLLFRAATYS